MPSQFKIGPGALLPGSADPVELERFCVDLVDRLQALAFEPTRRVED